MKAVIKSVEYVKEYETKFGTLFSHRVRYDDKLAFYSSKTKEQKYFIPGEEAEFTEEERFSDKGVYYIIKPVQNQRRSNYGKSLSREQSRYAGFAMSYAKDLAVAGLIGIDDLPRYTKSMFNLMVELDKTLES